MNEYKVGKQILFLGFNYFCLYTWLYLITRQLYQNNPIYLRIGISPLRARNFKLISKSSILL